MKAGPSTSHGACWSFPPIRISLLSDVPVASRVRGPAEARTLSFFNSRKGRDLKKRTGGREGRPIVRWANKVFQRFISLFHLPFNLGVSFHRRRRRFLFHNTQSFVCAQWKQKVWPRREAFRPADVVNRTPSKSRTSAGLRDSRSPTHCNTALITD